jgi:hypothetical protein
MYALLSQLLIVLSFGTLLAAAYLAPEVIRPHRRSTELVVILPTGTRVILERYKGAAFISDKDWLHLRNAIIGAERGRRRRWPRPGWPDSEPWAR